MALSHIIDTQNPVKRLLIPTIRERIASFHTVAMAVDIDDESAMLKFNLVLYLERGGSFFILQNFNRDITCIL